MNARSFLSLVEIRTKAASMIPLAVGTIYSVYHFHAFNAKNLLLLFISLLSFDMVTTGLNNYMDFKKSLKKEGYNYEKHNAIVEGNLSETAVLSVIVVLLAVAVASGILLFLNTDVLLLLIGMLSFGAGLAYSSGPVPISRTPLGELLSGLFMGFVIVFLSVYAHIYGMNIISVEFRSGTLILNAELWELLGIFLLSAPLVCCIANIMLANNICDIEDDLANRRYTLPVHIGKKSALWLFKALYITAYLDIIVLAAAGLLPLISLACLLTYIPVSRNVTAFFKEQTKKDTFALSVKNFLLIGISLAFTAGLPLLFY